LPRKRLRASRRGNAATGVVPLTRLNVMWVLSA
jgi:hypothetical protein